MWTLMLIAWWAALLGAAGQVWRARGFGPALAVVLGLWILAAQVDPGIGALVTGALALVIGAQAESDLRPTSGRAAAA